jgi:hypothetical protein
MYKDFNLTGNKDLAEASRLLENTLNGVTAELIRDSDAVRDKVKNDVDDILGKFGF